jgi:hypothetical protein
MAYSKPNPLHHTPAQQALWHAKAASQGLVCLICGRVPTLEHRHAFYDTGLCTSCASEIAPDGAEQD